MKTPLFSPRRRPLWLAAVLLASPDTARSATLILNGAFDSGGTGWSLLGGAEVVATGEPGDNPYGRIPDGPLVLLYQKAVSEAPLIRVRFDYFTGLMSPQFQSPGAFPDTAFASVQFGGSEAGLRPELFQSASSLALFDYDGANGLQSLVAGATVLPSPARPGWTRFDARRRAGTAAFFSHLPDAQWQRHSGGQRLPRG